MTYVNHPFYKDHEFWFFYIIHYLKTVRVRFTKGGVEPKWYVDDLNITYHNGLADYRHQTLECGENHLSTEYDLEVYADEHENYTRITMRIHVRRIGELNYIKVKINNRKHIDLVVDDNISNDVYYEIKLAYS